MAASDCLHARSQSLPTKVHPSSRWNPNSREVGDREEDRANPGAGEVSGMRIISSVDPGRRLSKLKPGFLAKESRSYGLRVLGKKIHSRGLPVSDPNSKESEPPMQPPERLRRFRIHSTPARRGVIYLQRFSTAWHTFRPPVGWVETQQLARAGSRPSLPGTRPRPSRMQPDCEPLYAMNDMPVPLARPDRSDRRGPRECSTRMALLSCGSIRRISSGIHRIDCGKSAILEIANSNKISS